MESGQFTDIHFLVGETEEVVAAHIAMVAARSEWLRTRIREARQARNVHINKLFGEAAAMSRPLQQDCPVLEVRLPEAEPTAFRMVLDFIYTDQIDPTKGRREQHATNGVVLAMMQVYMLAVQFYMKRLENLCIGYLEASIHHRNVLDALKNASQLKLYSIKEFCLRYIIKDSSYNKIVMSKEFETLDQPLMVEIIRRRQAPQLRSLQEGAQQEQGPTLPEDMRQFLLHRYTGAIRVADPNYCNIFRIRIQDLVNSDTDPT